MTLRWFLSTRAGRLILAAVSAMAVFVSAFFYRKGRNDQEAAYARRRVEAMKEAREVQNDVASKSSDDVHNALSKWLRDNNR
jgi:hypothetical protein